MAINPTITIRVNAAGTPSGNPSLFDLNITSSSDTSSYALGQVDGWCVDLKTDIAVPATYTGVKIYSSYEYNILAANPHFVTLGENSGNTLITAVPSDATAHPYLANFDMVNWLLNNVQVSSTTYNDSVILTTNANKVTNVTVNYYTLTNHPGQLFTYGDIQEAIYELLGDGWSNNAAFLGQTDGTRVKTIVDEAVAHDGFVPTAGQKLVVVLDTGANTQPLIMTTQAAALGDYVWHDLNANGIQDANETGIDGATVLLGRDLNNDGDINDPNELIATTTTGDNPNLAGTQHGYYEFDGLTPGLDYQVQFVMPAGYSAASPRQVGGNNAADSDGSMSNVVVLTPGQFNSTIDAGFYNYAGIGDFVWLDANANGIQDAGENGIDGVTVKLLDATNTVIATTTTGDDPHTPGAQHGYYEFTGLTPGSYSVQFVAPAGYTLSTANQGANDAVDSDAGAGGTTSSYTLTSGQFDNSVDAGLYQTAGIGDFVWLDSNANGIQDAGENGIDGVTVKLLDSTNTVIASTTTGDDPHTPGTQHGYYEFTGLTPGSYSVQFVAPAGYSISAKDQGANDATDSDADTVTGKTIAHTLTSGQFDNTVDAGLYQTAGIGDFVWLDANANGIQDAGENGIDGVTVKLLDSTNTVIATTTTGDDPHTPGTQHGYYEFASLTPGSYSVQFVAPAGYTLSTANQGANDALDSDAGAGGTTGSYTLTSGQFDNSVDAGLYQPPPAAVIDIEKLVHAEYTVKADGGTEGLTPGFWKNHSVYGPAPLSGWPETGYSPDDSYNAIFGVNIAGNPSLLDALGANGGGVNALMRHSASALLNAANPNLDYLYSVAQVISMTQAAINSGNAATIESTKDLFEQQNQLEGDLGTPAPTITVATPDVDADTGPGPTFLLGQTAVFTYVVTNHGTTPLANIVVTDDRIPAAAIHFLGGDTNNNNLLDTNETWTYTASELVQTTGLHTNVGTVVGTATGGGQATDNDAANYTAAVATFSTGNSTAFLAPNYDNLIYTGSGAFNGIGNTKDNVITGGIGNDTLDGRIGADTLIGGQGNDTYIVDNAGDKVIENGGEGTDTVKTTLASYTLPANVENLVYVGSGNFAGTGNGGDNSIMGGSGNDTLDGGAGNDTMAGGLGNDTYIVDSASDSVTEASGAGTDTVMTTLGNYTLGANIEKLTYIGFGNFAGSGNALANTIVGGAGNDTLDGAAGADTMTGGAGNDTYYVDNAGDVVNENAGEGADTVKTTLSSYTLGNNVENLIYTGAGAISGTGNTLANMLTGGGGGDTLTGGAGADSLTGGGGADSFVFSAADFGTVDEIMDFSHAAGDKIDLSAIDANPTVNKDQAFTFIGTNAFTHVIGQLHYTISGGAMLVQGDINGDGVADFTIKVDGTGGLVSTDFVL